MLIVKQDGEADFWGRKLLGWFPMVREEIFEALNQSSGER